jgi:hypothetical protein
MIQFLRIKNRPNRVRRDGGGFSEMALVQKTGKYGAIIKTEGLSKKKCLMVTGAHSSGKSRWIHRMYDAAGNLWGSRCTKNGPVMLEALHPILAWSEQDCVQAWWAEEQAKKPENEQKPWKSLRPHQRADALPAYVLATGAVVFCDDAHKLTGRKLQVARACLMAAKIFVIAASEETQLAPNLRSVVLDRKPQIIRLTSDVAYDATNVFMWIFMFACMVGGWYEAAAVLGGLKAISSGRRAARAN